MKVRVVREAGGLGDLVRVFSVFQGLRAKYPEAELHFYGIEHYRALFGYERPCPLINKFFATPFTITFRRPRLAPLDPAKWPYLDRGIEYDLDIDEFCPAFCWGEVDTDGDVVEDRGRIFCRAAGVPFSYPVWHVAPREAEFAERWYGHRRLDPARTIVLQPFGTTRNRNWPKEKWAALATRLIEAGYQPLVLDVCLRGMDIPGELEARLSYPQLGAVIRQARFAITGDSGLFHVAGAVGTRVLGLFGPTSGAVMCRGYPPGVAFALQANDMSVVKGTSAAACRPPCYGRPSRGSTEFCFKGACLLLDAISVDAVFDRAMELLRGRGGSAAVPRPAVEVRGTLAVRP